METVVNNEDLLTEILVLLPIKSLVKFKCVCKHWLDLITSHAFSTSRRSHLNSAGALLVHHNNNHIRYSFMKLDSYNYDSVPVDVFENNKPFLKTKIIQSCNGLFLCCDKSTIRRSLFGRYYIHTHSPGCCVWNPTSKKYTLLPPLLSLPCSLRGILSLRGISLAFDPSKSLEYKVVAVCQHNLLENCYQIQIYSSKAGSWRVSVRYFNPPPVNFHPGVFCNGTIHWMTSNVNFAWDFRQKMASTVYNLYFDIDQEQVRTLKIPRATFGSRLLNCFQVSGGSRLYLLRRLGTIFPRYGTSYDKFDVYQLCQDCSGWSVRHCVDLPDSLIFLDDHSTVVRLEKEDNKCFKASYVCRYDDAYHYIESLACV